MPVKPGTARESNSPVKPPRQLYDLAVYPFYYTLYVDSIYFICHIMLWEKVLLYTIKVLILKYGVGGLCLNKRKHPPPKKKSPLGEADKKRRLERSSRWGKRVSCTQTRHGVFQDKSTAPAKKHRKVSKGFLSSKVRYQSEKGRWVQKGKEFAKVEREGHSPECQAGTNQKQQEGPGLSEQRMARAELLCLYR